MCFAEATLHWQLGAKTGRASPHSRLHGELARDPALSDLWLCRCVPVGSPALTSVNRCAGLQSVLTQQSKAKAGQHCLGKSRARQDKCGSTAALNLQKVSKPPACRAQAVNFETAHNSKLHTPRNSRQANLFGRCCVSLMQNYAEHTSRRSCKRRPGNDIHQIKCTSQGDSHQKEQRGGRRLPAKAARASRSGIPEVVCCSRWPPLRAGARRVLYRRGAQILCSAGTAIDMLHSGAIMPAEASQGAFTMSLRCRKIKVLLTRTGNSPELYAWPKYLKWLQLSVLMGGT